jgi:hypothetical protein
MLEKLGFRQLVEEALTVKRKTKAMLLYEFVLAMVLAGYVSFSRLHQFRFPKREPTLTGIQRATSLPTQSTFWRFLAALHLGVAQQLLRLRRRIGDTVRFRRRCLVVLPSNNRLRLRSCVPLGPGSRRKEF